MKEDEKMDKAALKNAAFIAAIALVVFVGIATLVQLIDPQGGLLHVKYFASRIMVKSTFLMVISPPS